MKDYPVPFTIAFVVFCAAFLALDSVIMSLQGLNLFFSP